LTKALRTALDKAIIGYIRKFEKAHGVEFDWAVNNDLTGMLCFGDHMFNMSDIVYDVDNQLPIMLIFEWQEARLNAHFLSNEKAISLQSYVKGLRYHESI
jgi:hypothetical protein